MRLIKVRTNALGLTFEGVTYVKSKNIMFGGRCVQHRAIIIKLHLVWVSLIQWIPFGKVKQKD
jgi:hypothetical protein